MVLSCQWLDACVSCLHHLKSRWNTYLILGRELSDADLFRTCLVVRPPPFLCRRELAIGVDILCCLFGIQEMGHGVSLTKDEKSKPPQRHSQVVSNLQLSIPPLSISEFKSPVLSKCYGLNASLPTARV